MLQLLHIILLGLTSLPIGALAYPQDLRPKSAPLHVRDDSKFILGAIGDSWASGVSYRPNNQYDDNTSGCMRYKYAWSTVVNGQYSQWTPDTNKPSGFEFKACSGAHLENMKDQMDQLTRPNLVIMEAGGNNADFYPMADACLFQADPTKSYGRRYEDDTDPNNRMGECRKEIDLVRSRLQGDNMKNLVTDTIHQWRGHKSVVGNDASLFVLGYARFFGPDLDDACDKWNFAVLWQKAPQNIVKAMRAEFNELVDLMNGAIRQAAESFNDDKIQYVDINPSLEGHRFCEKGHTRMQQYNWGPEVQLWNNPAKWTTTIKNGNEVKTYDPDNGVLPPQDIIDKLNNFVDGVPRQEGEFFILTWRSHDYPDLVMEWKARPQDFEASGIDLPGMKARTLHPTEDGHREIGNVIVRQLQRHYNRASGQ